LGAIATAFNKDGAKAASLVLIMLEELKHRGIKTHTVVTHPSRFITQMLGKLKQEKTSSKLAIGTNSSEPILGENYAWILEGQYLHPTPSILHQIMHKTEHHPLETTRQILKEIDGSYTFAIAFPDKVAMGRDTMGINPLYYGENKSTCAAASERKALWKIGITNVQTFPPGNLAILNEEGFTFEPISILKPLPQIETNMPNAMKQLQKLLEESTQERCLNAKEVAVAFSGGVDSSVIACLAKLAGANAHLICVGLKDQSEIEHAKDTAENLGLPITVQTYTVKDVENVLRKVLWLIEEPNAMKVGVAIPFYWTAETASKLGYNVLLAGQGADELFGGYHRYLTEYAKGGAEKVTEILYHDVAKSYETNFQRDEPVCSYHKVELRLPFVDAEVVRFALSLPLKLKIESAQDNLRKRILRQVAINLGIPASVADKPKKAVQFATGVDKALKKLATMEGLTQRSYIEKAFREVYSDTRVKNK
jgi:asparagine synthase (glutamine-hydrolysing)